MRRIVKTAPDNSVGPTAELTAAEFDAALPEIEALLNSLSEVDDAIVLTGAMGSLGVRRFVETHGLTLDEAMVFLDKEFEFDDLIDNWGVSGVMDLFMAIDEAIAFAENEFHAQIRQQSAMPCRGWRQPLTVLPAAYSPRRQAPSRALSPRRSRAHSLPGGKWLARRAA